LPAMQTVDEDTPLQIHGISIADVDVEDRPMTVTLSVSRGTLTLGTIDGLTFAQGDGTNDTQLTFSGTIADLNAALHALTYQGTLDANGPDRLEITVDDQGNIGSGGSLVAAGSVDIDVLPVNDAPTLSLPAMQTVDEDTPLQIHGISIADVDVEDRPMTVTLSVSRGTLTLGTIDGLTFAQGDGTNDAQLTFSGTITDLNAALHALTYQGTLNANGPDRLEITVDDQGNIGSGGSLVAAGSVDIDVLPVNDAPVGIGEKYKVRGDELLIVDGPGVLRNDYDVDGDPLSAALERGPDHGELRLRKDGSFVYKPDPSFIGVDSFVYRVVDSSGAYDSVRVTIAVAAPTSPVETSAPAGTQTPANQPAASAVPDQMQLPFNLGFLDHEMPDRDHEHVQEATASRRSQDVSGDDWELNADGQSSESARWQITDDPDGMGSQRGVSRARYADVEYQPLQPLTDPAMVYRDPATTAIDTTSMWGDLDQLDGLLNNEDAMHRLMVGSAVGLTTGLTVGYVLWTIRAGYLLTGLIAQAPAWRFVDPLPILDNLNSGSMVSDGESLQSIIASDNAGVSQAGL